MATTTATAFDWSAVARGWDARRHFTERAKHDLTEQLVAGLRLEPGARVLELGAGTGELALRLADLVGPSGRVHATDAAPGMVDLIRAAAGGRGNVDVSVVDAAGTGLPSAGYDAVAFRMGLMLLPDPAQGLRECHRVLRDGGRLGVAVWAGPERNPWLTAVGMAAMMSGVVAGGPPTAPTGVFSISSADTLRRLAGEAGFTDVSVSEVDLTMTYASAEDHFDTVTTLAGPLAAALAAAPQEQVAATKQVAAQAIARFATGDGYAIPAQALLVLATK